MQTLEEIKQKYPGIDVNLDGGTDSYQDGKPIVERYNIAAIVKHPTEEKYLIAQWKKSVWNGFVTGGIEDNKTPEDTAREEIREETGYKNFSKVIATEGACHGLFFHPVKDVNRLAHYTLVIVNLEDLDKDETDAAEQSIADFNWIPKEEVATLLTRSDMKSLWQYYIDNPSL